MLTPFVKPRQVLSVKVASNLVLQNRDSSFLDVAIATKFLSVKLAQNCRETILSVKVRVHILLSYRGKFLFLNDPIMNELIQGKKIGHFQLASNAELFIITPFKGATSAQNFKNTFSKCFLKQLSQVDRFQVINYLFQPTDVLYLISLLTANNNKLTQF